MNLQEILNYEHSFKGSYINNKWILNNKHDEHYEVRSPANLEWHLGAIHGSYHEVNQAIQHANNAFKTWKQLSTADREKLLYRFSEELEKRKEVIARYISIENGKPYAEALGEAGLMKKKIDITIQYAQALVATQNLDFGELGKGEIHWKAKGVQAIIGPFNFPVHLNHGLIVPALLMGNVCILKASEKTPFSAQCYMEAFHEAGFPPGVLQLIQGGPKVSTELIRHPDVHGVMATCSYEVGRKIQEITSIAPEKSVALEMGGKNAAIVWSTKDVQALAKNLIKSVYLTTGQRCTALSRIYVNKEIIENVLEEFHKLSKEICIAQPFQKEPLPYMGPIISEAAREKVLKYANIAKKENIECIMRPKILEGQSSQHDNSLPKGWYLTPGIHYAKKWTPESTYQSHEIFGPDCFFAPIESLEEGIQAVNSAPYGLSFSCFTTEEAEFEKVAEEIECGLLYWNRPTVGASGRLPFGGWKRSGNGKPAGLYAILAASQIQARMK